jgi:hypothetical protein
MGNLFIYIFRTVHQGIELKVEDRSLQRAGRFLSQHTRAHGHRDGQHLNSLGEAQQRLKAIGGLYLNRTMLLDGVNHMPNKIVQGKCKLCLVRLLGLPPTRPRGATPILTLSRGFGDVHYWNSAQVDRVTLGKNLTHSGKELVMDAKISSQLVPSPAAAALFLIMACAFAIIAMPLQAQTFQVIHNFTNGLDGGSPYAGLTIDAAGNLYGTAVSAASSLATARPPVVGSFTKLLTPVPTLYSLRSTVSPERTTANTLRTGSSSGRTEVCLARL